MRWSVFCRVVDNYGDAGFCLRLARELQARGEQVTLFIDDARPLAWMLGDAAHPPEIHPWPSENAPVELGEVVIEAFGCALPEGVQRVIAQRRPLWINLEYLSAEAYVERSHGLPSPVMSGPARGCVKRFCYPGFTPSTGGLLREQDLMTRWQRHDAAAFWYSLGLPPAQDGERQISLFAYPDAPLAALLQSLQGAPTRLLVSPGLHVPAAPDPIRVQALPWLSQDQYDRLLWSCELNLVRGEDSFVRAQWAGKPFLWHIYRQDDGVHREKLDAFLRRYGGPPGAWHAWIEPDARNLDLSWHLSAAGQTHALAWRDQMRAGPELVNTLLTWARETA